MRHPRPRPLTRFLRPYDRHIRELAWELRDVILGELAPCYENIYDAYSAVAIGYGTSERLSDGILHLAVYAKGVNLGFNDGATLGDPKGILQGHGSRIRHIPIKSSDDLKRLEIAVYIRRARKKALAEATRLGEQPKPQPSNVVSTVKAIYANKRRPGRPR